MELFPGDFNLKNCMNIIKKNQEVLIKEIRKEFYENVMLAADKCEQSVELKFPEKLWPEYRVTLAKEILKRFGEIHMTTIKGDYKVTRITSENHDIPKYLSMIKIVFYNYK